MNDFPIINCIGPELKGGIDCHSSPNLQELVSCPDCIHYLNSKIPKSKQKFLRDMIFSTGDFDEK